MPTYEERMLTQLDRDKPGWHVDWADHRDLQDMANGNLTTEKLKSRVFMQIIHYVVSAAISADLVKVVDND